MAVKRVRIKNKHHAWVKWVIGLGILAALGISFAVSVAVGNWLLEKAEQYPAKQEQESVSVPPEQIVPVRVPSIKAYAYELGGKYSGFTYSGIFHLCAPLRDTEGALTYFSRVCEHAGWEQNGRVDLAMNVWELHQNGLYLSTYIPITGFAEQDAAIRELKLSYEAALIVEAAESGVNEIFLTDLEPTKANITEVVQYVRHVKSLVGKTAIGVLITPEVLLAEEYDVYLAAQLMSVCDFLVLDLRHLPLDDKAADTQTGTEEGSEAETELETETEQGSTTEQRVLSVTYVMEHMQYDLIRYSPRLALGEQQTDALDYIIAKGYGNWVIMNE